MLNRTQVKRRIRQRGLSLVELMVAILIGLILIAGMIQLFVANKRAYRLQEDLLVQEENARFSLLTLGYDLRMAGHWGGVPVEDLSKNLTMSGCEAALITSRLEDITGYEGGNSSPLPAGCSSNVAAGDYVENSDVIVIRYAAVDERVTTANLTAGNSGNNASRPFIGSIAGFGGMLATGTALAAAETAGNKLHDASKGSPREGVYNYPLYAAAYFIRPCSVKASTTCATSDDGGDPIPTLTRLVLQGGSFTQEAVAEGVEQMQVEYGIGDFDGNISEYKKAVSMGGSDWAKVSAVRIGLLVRSNERDPAFEDSHTTDETAYTMPGGYSHKVTADKKYYRRKLVTQVLRVRNKGKS